MKGGRKFLFSYQSYESEAMEFGHGFDWFGLFYLIFDSRLLCRVDYLTTFPLQCLVCLMFVHLDGCLWLSTGSFAHSDEN